eukprot:m.113043 g.113043  ORF g.113043 m.113043 type:complete len:323 (-) comp28239_c0_seq1:246-1214(-)
MGRRGGHHHHHAKRRAHAHHRHHRRAGHGHGHLNRHNHIHHIHHAHHRRGHFASQGHRIHHRHRTRAHFHQFRHSNRTGGVHKMHFHNTSGATFGAQGDANDTSALEAARIGGGLFENRGTHKCTFKFVNVLSYIDANNTGMATELGIDTLGDGMVDTVATTVDTTGNGIGDSILFDSNGDGIKDSMLSVNLPAIGQNVPMTVKATSVDTIEILACETARNRLTLGAIIDSLDAWGDAFVAQQVKVQFPRAFSDFTINTVHMGNLVAQRAPPSSDGALGAFNVDVNMNISNELASANYMFTVDVMSEVLVQQMRSPPCCTIS